MHISRGFVALIATLSIAALAHGQREKRQPLTEAQVEKVREAAINPSERIRLYTQFLDEHAATLKDLADRPKSGSRAKRLDDELQDFTALLDELASNLDQYGQRKADMRPALKKLNEDCPRWLDMLKTFPTEPSYDTARKEAMES